MTKSTRFTAEEIKRNKKVRNAVNGMLEQTWKVKDGYGGQSRLARTSQSHQTYPIGYVVFVYNTTLGVRVRNFLDRNGKYRYAQGSKVYIYLNDRHGRNQGDIEKFAFKIAELDAYEYEWLIDATREKAEWILFCCSGSWYAANPDSACRKANELMEEKDANVTMNPLFWST